MSIERLLFTVFAGVALAGHAAGRETPNSNAPGPAKGLATDAGLKRVGQLCARHSNEISGSPWGVSCHWIAEKHELTTDQRVEQLARLGAKWGFLVPDWDRIETEKGKYNFNSPDHRLDDAVYGMVKRKITPIIQIYGGNRLYMPAVADPNKRQKAAAAKLLDDAEVRQAWHRFLETMVRRYQAHVKVWEIWNEPNGPWFWQGPTTVDQYGRIVKEVSQVIKSVDPEAVILAGSTASIPMDFFQGLLKSEGADSFDFCSMHPYGAVPEQADTSIHALQKLLESRGKSPVLWQSECGFPSSGDTGGWGFGGPWNETKHAKWVLRRLLCDAAMGARVSIYFVLNDYPSLYEAGPDRGKMAVNRKGLYAAGSWTPKPSAFAFKHLASLIDDRLGPKPLDVSIDVTDAGSFDSIEPKAVRAFALVDKSTFAPMILYWLPVAIQTEVRPATITMRVDSGKLREPVLVDLLDGRVYDLSAKIMTDGSSMTLRGLPLGDSPLAVCERAAVNLE